MVGEALIDLVPRDPDGLYQAVPGGSPANVAVGLARLQVPARMVARVADDPFGRRIRRHLAGNGVDLGAVVTAAEPTSLAIVEVEPDGAVSYDFRVDGTADWQWRDAELGGVLGGGLLALHAGSLALTMPPGADVLLRLLQRARGSVTISYDPNARPLLMGSPARTLERVERLVALADVVKASVEDVAWLVPGRPAEEVAAAWLALGPALVAITCGADGVVAVAAGTGLLRRPARRVTVVDTVGAGDAFTSALLAGLHRRGLLGAERRAALAAIGEAPLTEVLDEAVLAAAITCTRRGADPPVLAELLG